ncbi:MAG TPA: two-component regulator propeller domain-containing protein [Bacteroidota bacterium]|nr:two-component regulator propeller domain-containing protein [Bacteroidota bacterium]
MIFTDSFFTLPLVKRCLARALFLPLFISPLLAQQLPLRTFTSRDGLPRSEVRVLCQDSLGYLWCGTDDGFSRYDGSTFSNFNISGGPGSNLVNAFLPGEQGDLWVASNGGGLTHCRDGSLRHIAVTPADPAAKGNRVNALLKLADHRLLAGTDDGAFLFDGESFVPLHVEAVPLSRGVEVVFKDHAGRIWLTTPHGVYLTTEPSLSKWLDVSPADTPSVSALADDGAGDIFLGTESGLRMMRFEAGALTGPVRTELPAELSPLARKSVQSLLSDNDGALWIGTQNNGLYQYSGGFLANFTTANGLPANNILALMQDRESNIWIATNAGLCKLSTRSIVNYTLSGSLAHSYVSAIAEDGRGSVWFGTPYGLSRLSAGRFTNYFASDGLSSNYVLSIQADRAGAIWVGTSKGLSRLDAGRNRFESVGARRPSAANIVRSMYEDETGLLWIGREGGFSVLANGRFVDFRFPDSLRDQLVVDIVKDMRGNLWVGAQGEGLFRYAVSRSGSAAPTVRLKCTYTTKDGLSDASIRSLLVDKDGVLWVGTRFGGINRLALGADGSVRISHYTSAEGLSGDWVREMIQDSRGDLWVATDRGVDRLPVSGGITAVKLSARQGIAGDEAYAVYEDRKGSIWIGATNGATCYSPRAEARAVAPPPVYLQRVQILGVDDSLALRRGSAELGAEQHSLSFEYVGLSFIDEKAVRYRYILEGLDADWSPPTDHRYVTYAHLPHGNYTFKVQACAGDGAWSLKPATFSFSVASPYWARWWFLSAVTALLTTLAFALHRLRVQRIMEMERVRRRIAADLHDDIGSTLSSISIFSRLAAHELERNPRGAASLLERIGTSSQAIMESLDDIVWMIRPGNDALSVIMTRIREYATPLCEARNIQFDLSMGDELGDLKMSLEDRRQFYLIAKEAITNIVKHSNCSRAEVALAVNKKELVLSIRDNGQGFNGIGRSNGNGLLNMQDRAAAMGGHLSVESRNGEGTAIFLHSKIT